MTEQYTIKEVSEKMQIPVTTLRYYDKEGLLPNLGRNQSGYRLFSKGDLATLQVIDCLKRSGMSIREIKQFTAWVNQGDQSLQERYQLFQQRKQAVEQQIAQLHKMLDFIEYKCWYYETAIAAGTEAVHRREPAGGKLPCEK